MNVVNSYFQDCKLFPAFERDRLGWLNFCADPYYPLLKYINRIGI